MYTKGIASDPAFILDAMALKLSILMSTSISEFYLNKNLNDKQVIDHAHSTFWKKNSSRDFCLIKDKGGLMHNSYTQLFTSLVVSILDYDSVLWGYHPQLSIIEKNAMHDVFSRL